MSLKEPQRANGVKREDKESKLKDFIQQGIARRGAASQGGPDRGTLLLVARSAESPVAKAVFALSAEIGRSNLALRAIFANLGSTETARIAEACTESDLDLQIRWARDVRLMDAHEQLVLLPDTSWIGDCMRRDPTKRDAFEASAIDSRETAHRASICFERLWAASEPVIERKPAALPATGAKAGTEAGAGALGQAHPDEQDPDEQVPEGSAETCH
jgi:hypothetical protein